MAYMTHGFAHQETLQRALRWLVQMGFDPSHIEVHTEGIPRIALAVDPAHWAEAELLIDAAERTDPHGQPSFWELARLSHIDAGARAGTGVSEVVPPLVHTQTTAISWHNPDAEWDEDTYIAGIREMMSRFK